MDPGSHVGFQISTKNTNLVEDNIVESGVKHHKPNQPNKSMAEIMI
jgi:hypothetical protein